MAAQPIFHASIEGAQHGAKSLADFLDYAKRSAASDVQPSNYMLQGGKLFKSVKEIKDTFEQRGMTLNGISAHCPFWIHARTGTRSRHPFIAVWETPERKETHEKKKEKKRRPSQRMAPRDAHRLLAKESDAQNWQQTRAIKPCGLPHIASRLGSAVATPCRSGYSNRFGCRLGSAARLSLRAIR
jgi:hypothetical protein